MLMEEIGTLRAFAALQLAHCGRSRRCNISVCCQGDSGSASGAVLHGAGECALLHEAG